MSIPFLSPEPPGPRFRWYFLRLRGTLGRLVILQRVVSSTLMTVLVWWIAAPAPIWSQTASGAQLTAAFLVNFARFTEWPADVVAPTAPITLCAADPVVVDALWAATAGQTVAAHPLVTGLVGMTPPPRQCQVLYVAGLSGRRVEALAASLAGASVLLVGDNGEFTKRGGIMHLFVEDGTMKFAVNVDAADRARLRLSSRLLALARIVRD